jgi:hypothetical protein
MCYRLFDDNILTRRQQFDFDDTIVTPMSSNVTLYSYTGHKIFKPLTRIELVTSSLPMKCSTTELQRQIGILMRLEEASRRIIFHEWAELDLNQRSSRSGFTVRPH